MIQSIITALGLFLLSQLLVVWIPVILIIICEAIGVQFSKYSLQTYLKAVLVYELIYFLVGCVIIFRFYWPPITENLIRIPYWPIMVTYLLKLP